MYFESLSFLKKLLVNVAKKMAARLSLSGAVGAEKLQEKA
jgi:hypothetical protein